MGDGEATASPPRYDTIGVSYAARRRPDPRIASAISDALGDAHTILNVGAGTGNYEPDDRPVLAVEPSSIMAVQRSPDRLPAVLGVAERLPFVDKSFDAVMAILTIHHWSDARAGVREALRVARRRIVILTVDTVVQGRLWLFDEYLRDVAAREAVAFPPMSALLAWLGPSVETRVVPVPRDCTDGFLLSFWGRPEGLLDQGARRATSGFARLGPGREAAVIASLAHDLDCGRWDERHGALRALDEYDPGLRLIVAEVAR
jgi:SAM-dependent methyltransferase